MWAYKESRGNIGIQAGHIVKMLQRALFGCMWLMAGASMGWESGITAILGRNWAVRKNQKREGMDHAGKNSWEI